MRRARKKFLSIGKKARSGKSGLSDLKENSVNPIDEVVINDDEKKNLQIKYFGKVFEEEEEPAPPVLEETAEEAFEENAEENVKENVEEDIEAQNTSEESEANDKVSLEETQRIVLDEKTINEYKNSVKDEEKIEEEDVKAAPVVSENVKSKGKKAKKKGSKKKFALILSISLLVIIVSFIAVMCIGGFFDTPLNNDLLTYEDYMEPIDTVTGKVNVLVLGVDNEGLRTDTMIVASFDTDDGTVDLLSIPRDTRMFIGSKYQKINAAHAISQKNGKIKGPQGSIEAVTRLTGIPINHYVEFSFSAFRDTIDALDGVYYNVAQNMNYDDPVQNLHIHLTQGYQLLDGDKAEQLVRFRSYPEGDIKRVRVQQDFIRTLTEQKLNASIITKLPDLYKSLTKNVKTSFKISDMTKYASSLMNLKTENIKMYELPGNYSGSEYTASYWLPDMNKIKELVETVFGYDTTFITNGKAIEGAIYGKTISSSPYSAGSTVIGNEDSETASPSPSQTPSETASAKPSSTPKATRSPKSSQTPKPSASAKNDKDDKDDKKDENNDNGDSNNSSNTSEEPTPSPKNTATAKPQPSYGSSSSDSSPTTPSQSEMVISEVHKPPVSSGNNTPSAVNTPKPTPPVQQDTPKPVQPTPVAPSDNSNDNNSSGGFKRPGAN